MEVKNSLLINICLLVVSTACTLVLGYFAYDYFRNPPANILFKDSNDEYMFSLYNRKGEKISDIHGSLKLMLDPFTIYQNYPNQKSQKYSINSHGFRDTYTSDKPSTAIVLGGSAAFGFALDGNGQTFSSHISKNNDKYNIINAAVVGFLSGQELAQMIHYLDRFDPLLYIVFDGWNDIYDPVAFTRSAFKAKETIHQSPIGFNNAFFGIESRLTDYYRITRKDKNITYIQLNPIDDLISETELLKRIVEKYLDNVEKMYSFASARGAKFLLIFQPELGNKKIHSSNERETLKMWIEKYSYFENQITERYKKFTNEAKGHLYKKNIPFIDMNTETEFSENPNTLFFDVVHPNPLGHEIIAQIINQILVDKF